MSDWIPLKLQEAAGEVAKGNRPEVTVRELISWFGYQRRHTWVVGRIRQALKRANVTTKPDFDWTYLDGLVSFMPMPDHPEGAGASTQLKGAVEASSSASATLSVGEATEVLTRQQMDPTYRIARLKSARTQPVSVSPDAALSEAITLMMKRRFSQLPVLSGRTVKGIVSWTTIGRKLALGVKCNCVRDAMDRVKPSQLIDVSASLLEASRLIAEHECLLVRDESHQICGILTASDLSDRFGTLSEAFLLIGEIEHRIRTLLDGKFTRQELEEVRDPLDVEKPINDASDLAFGGYVRLLQDPTKWAKLNLQLDRTTFVKALDEVRQVRNNVMHFDPDGPTEDEVQKLRDFADLLKQIQEVYSTEATDV